MNATFTIHAVCAHMHSFVCTDIADGLGSIIHILGAVMIQKYNTDLHVLSKAYHTYRVGKPSHRH